MKCSVGSGLPASQWRSFIGPITSLRLTVPFPLLSSTAWCAAVCILNSPPLLLSAALKRRNGEEGGGNSGNTHCHMLCAISKEIGIEVTEIMVLCVQTKGGIIILAGTNGGLLLWVHKGGLLLWRTQSGYYFWMGRKEGHYYYGAQMGHYYFVVGTMVELLLWGMEYVFGARRVPMGAAAGWGLCAEMSCDWKKASCPSEKNGKRTTTIRS